MKDFEVVDAFVALLPDRSAPGLQVDRRPDKEKAGDIDAAALRGRCTARPRAGLLRLVRAGRKRRVGERLLSALWP